MLLLAVARQEVCSNRPFKNALVKEVSCLPCRPHSFRAVYSVHLHGEDLQTDLRVINTGDSAFEFTAALHSYFEVRKPRGMTASPQVGC